MKTIKELTQHGFKLRRFVLVASCISAAGAALCISAADSCMTKIYDAVADDHCYNGFSEACSNWNAAGSPEGQSPYCSKGYWDTTWCGAVCYNYGSITGDKCAADKDSLEVAKFEKTGTPAVTDDPVSCTCVDWAAEYTETTSTLYYDKLEQCAVG